jgi:hypothetical protein
MKATNTGPGRSAALLLLGAILLVACTSNLFPVTEKQPAIKDTNSEPKERETESDSKIGTGPGHRDTATATDTGPGHRDTATATDTGTGTGAGVPTDTGPPSSTDSEVNNWRIGEQCCQIMDWICKPEEGWYINHDIKCKYPEQRCCQVDCVHFGGHCVPKGTNACYIENEFVNPEYVAICPPDQICCSLEEPRACGFLNLHDTSMRCLGMEGPDDTSMLLKRCSDAGGTSGRGCPGDDVCCYDYDSEKLDDGRDDNMK